MREKGLWHRRGGLQSSRGPPRGVREAFTDGEDLGESREGLGYYERILEASMSVGQDDEKPSLVGVETSTGK